jgi:2-deoxy-D-gluconate 3-dehydrogenase
MSSDLFSLDGRVALVTGGSRGIGKMIARGFLEAGAKVYITSRDAAGCEAAARDLGQNCVALPEDLSKPEGVERLATAFKALEPKLDILVNNAGAAWGAGFHDFPQEGWDKVLDLNLKAPFFLVQQLHDRLAAAGKAERLSKVINIASVDGLSLNQSKTFSYHASKAALIHLTRRLASELIADHIAVTAIAPGHFATDMNKRARDRGPEVAQTIPSRRVGVADDIAACAIYLAARSGDYVIGATIPVDGGIAFAALRRDGVPS